MHALAPISVLPASARTLSALDKAPDGGAARGLLRVDLDDAVFFDHPLDHVPGMLLVVAGLELAEHAALLRPAGVSFCLTFSRFCELDVPVEVRVHRELGVAALEFLQSDRSIARGQLGRREAAPPVELARAPAFGDGLIPGELVHRADPGNIALGPLTVDAGCVWVRAREQAAIAGISPRAGAVASIIEAARQFVIAILHLWGQQPMGTKMIFVGLTADVPTALPKGHMKLALSWLPTAPEQTRKLHIAVHAVGDRAIRVGSIDFASRCVDEVEYARLRAG